MTAGILATELLQEYTNVMKERVQPSSQLSIINGQLFGQHQFLKLHHANIYTYYSIRNVNLYLQEDQYFIHIPVLLKIYDQEFRLYKLQPIHLPLPNQANQWMIL